MPRRSQDNRDERTIPTPRLDEPSAIRGAGMPDSADPGLTGVVGDASAASGQSRSGEDTRRRGWFWHWNSIVTQFAPIIGLKGVGLLNSYTVWTDRREESPRRGYAFPSQQSEAAFYGEDRNELITINKLLVALDLIEIKKEMVLRTDEKGRRWKVPHNLYRVKDHGDEFNLSADDVMRVARLAEKDRAVYRYVRRIFSPKFAPIDAGNIWHEILEEVRETETWQRLAARTERDEQRASARSKAGHASRRGSTASEPFSLPDDGDTTASEATAPDTGNDSTGGNTNDSDGAATTSVAPSNTGSRTSVARSSKGSTRKSTSTAAPANNGQPTSVAPTSTTYHQALTTTTTGSENDRSTETTPVQDGYGPGNPPDDQRDEELALQLFTEANDRPTSVAAKRQLKKIATDFDGLAESAGVTGWALVGSAIEEAVASGSAFVAPKRVREIVTRWSRDGVPDMYASASPVRAGASQPVTSPVTGEGSSSHRSGRDIGLPGGDDPDAAWRACCDALGATVPASDRASLRRDVVIAAYARGKVTLQAANADLADEIEGQWRNAIQRKLSVVLRRPVRVTVTGPDDDPDGARAAVPVASSIERPPARLAVPVPAARQALPVFRVDECGMSNTQVWTAVLDDLRADGAIPRPEIESWLRDSALIGREGDAFIIGVPHALAERRANRFLAALEAATAHIVGVDCAIRIVRTQDWLASTGTDG